MPSLSNMSQEEIWDIVENRWLGLGDPSKLNLVNPLLPTCAADIENPTEHIVSLMRQQDYLWFTSRYVLNKTLIPFQQAILRELWLRPFPMLIGSRGLGKCVTGDTLIMTDERVCRIDELAGGGDTMQPVGCGGVSVLGENGFRPVAYGWCNGKTETTRIRTRHGFLLEGTSDHPVRVASRGGVVWKNLGDITEDDVVVIDRTPSWHPGTSDVSPSMAYLFGLLVGDGGYTKRGNITLTTADREILDSANGIAAELWGKTFRKIPSAKYDHLLCGVDIWTELFDKYGFNSSVCGEKSYPSSVLRAGKPAVAAFIRGLMDTDGHCNEKSGQVEFVSKSQELVRLTQFILLRFGVVSMRKSRVNKKYGTRYHYLYVSGPSLRTFRDTIGFGLTRKQDALSRACLKTPNANLDVVPRRVCGDAVLTLLRERMSRLGRRKRGSGRDKPPMTPSRLRSYRPTYDRLRRLLEASVVVADTAAYANISELISRNHFFDAVVSVERSEATTYDVHVPDDHSFVSNGLISHNTWLLGVYCILRALICQGVKIVCVGSGYRQAKYVFEVISEIWRNAPVLRSLCSGHKTAGPKHDIDRCHFVLGESIVVFLPIGDGSKIRGQRANILLAEEFASQSEHIFDTVVSPFAAVAMDPVEKVKALARQEAMVEYGIMEKPEITQTIPGLNSNQTVLSGTAWYSFNHFFRQFSKYKNIIESRGDRQKLEAVFGGNVPEDFDWRSYAIIRMPSRMLPKGFLDEKTVANQRAKLHLSQYLMEFGACVGPGTMVQCDVGLKAIEDVEVGDRVLTHEGRFRPVLRRTCRRVSRDVLRWGTFGCNSITLTTADHPFWDGSGWQTLHEMRDTSLARLRELSGETSFDLRRVATNYMEHGDMIYPRRGHSRYSREEIAAIRSSPLNLVESAKLYDTSPGHIWAIRANKKPKHVIPSVVPLNYDMGLAVGYYASEGYGGAEGRSVGFALDGHVNETLASYVDELSGALERLFGLTPKRYVKDGVINVVINQRLVVEFFKWVCPGVSHTKFIRPEILYSNPEFLRGFVTGYWNGDGHRSEANGKVIAGCVNPSLLSQVRLAAGYFGVLGGIYHRGNRGPTVLRGKSYDTKPITVLEYYGNNARAFHRVFYNSAIADMDSKQRMSVDGNRISLRVNKKETAPYDGYVFNLEVEEDHSYSLLNATVHNCWIGDTNGFFPRSLIQRCVVGQPESPIDLPDYGTVVFNAVLRGQMGLKYVIAADPASEQDNFSIVILELHKNHRRVVYCWTTTRAKHRQKVARGMVKEANFYSHAARKLRELATLFPASVIAIDSQGGGIAVFEALADPSQLNEGEVPFLPTIDEDEEKPTDSMPGEHIIEVVNFADANWVAEANHGMKKDLESQVLLFPEYDSATVGLSIEEDKMMGRADVHIDDTEQLYDTLEDCVLNCEELKEELATIVHTQTGTSMRDRWSTPEVKEPNGRKGRLRKDRYSALLMANMAARTLARQVKAEGYDYLGGFAGDLAKKEDRQVARARNRHHQNPDWYTRMAGGGGHYGGVERN